uniref:Laminin EGF-like domain-containing protein n=1 Tax=Tetradesmus obliquus TaxID=3088 RepID=A0A383V6N3_TETOB|eukprot:jgi/Sobl393_1/13663/SZX60379.1
MKSPAGSISFQDCLCIPGTGYNSSWGPQGACLTCWAGQWSLGNSLGVCFPCGNNKTTPGEGSTTRAQCTLCAPGYGGPRCQLCPLGTYSNNNSECVPCDGPNETSPAGSNSKASCTCAPGFGGSTCQRCPRNSWSAGGSRAPCVACGYGLISQSGASGIEYCQCPAGYGAVSGARQITNSMCSLCPAGTFSMGLPTDAQLQRAARARNAVLSQLAPVSVRLAGGARNNATVAVQIKPKDRIAVLRATVASCTFCPDGKTSDMGANSPDMCYCRAGTYGPSCEKVSFGNYSARLFGTLALSTMLPFSTLKQQQQQLLQRHMLHCLASSFCPGGRQRTLAQYQSAEAPIVQCAETEVSLPGAATPAACVCAPGYGGARCTQCPIGTWHPGGDRTPCKRCGPGLTTTVAGADSRDYCQCTPGTAACNACRPGTWSNALPSSSSSPAACNPCPGNRTSDPSATDPSQCYCPAGTFDQSGGCVPCPTGRWCPGGSSSKPTGAVSNACGPNQTSKPGSTTESDCVCQAGTGSFPACTPCPSGSFNRGDSRLCTPCGYGLVSLPGATGPEYCQCPAGYGASGASSCSLCPPGSFGRGPVTAITSAPANTSTRSASNTGGARSLLELPQVAARGPSRTLAQTQPPSPLLSLLPCTACFNGMLSKPGSKDASDCECAPGTFGPDCRPCPQGSFCEGGKPTPTPCPGNTTSNIGSRTSADCWCLPGYGGRSCGVCLLGSYSGGGDFKACTTCPLGFTTAATASTVREQCICSEGSGNGNPALTGSCTLCPPGTWARNAQGSLAANTARECAPCPTGKTSDFGISNPGLCYCPPGTYGRDTCQTCLAGRWCPGGSPNTSAPIFACNGPSETSLPGAQSQQDCVCAAGYGGPSCELCPLNTFSTGGSRAPCSPCGYGIITRQPGATSKDMCTCTPGYGSCTSCAAGTYATYGANGTDIVCKACPGGRTSDFGATGPEQCFCPAGTFGPTCQNCTANFYCPGGSPKSTDAPAIACGPNQSSAAGAKSQGDCTCAPGYGGSSCAICGLGFFSAGGSRDPCSKCDFGTSTTQQGATSKNQCQCQPGYGVNCTSCPAGTYQNGVPTVNATGSALPCVACPSGKTSDPGATDVSQCYCPAGTFGSTCQNCTANFYCPGGSSKATEAPAIACGPNQSSAPGAKAQAECACAPGYGGSSCAICGLGFFSAGGSRDPCSKCDFGTSTTQAGATSKSQCQCQPGYGANCATCPAGTYQDGVPLVNANGASLPCVACPGRKTSNPGASNVSQCFCPPGTFGLDCTDCVAGSWCPGGFAAPITSCAANMQSPPGSKTESTCVCVAGFGWDGYQCSRCSRGQFSTGNSRQPCSQCPSGTTSIEGSTSAAACVCLPGSGGNCAVCPPGTWSSGLPSNTGSPDVLCQNCPTGQTSDTGATSPDDCYCPAGTYGTACDPCLAGSYCPAGGTITRCPTNMYSPARAKSVDECVCNPGYGGQDCDICAPGTFAAGGNRSSCSVCPLGLTTAISGAPSASYCQCPAGSGAAASNAAAKCALCLPGYWSNGLPNGGLVGTTLTCQACPSATQTSNMGAKDPSECWGPPAPRISCGSNKKTVTNGAGSADLCVCKPGYGGPDCTLCSSGSYSAGGTLDDCKKCPTTMSTEIVGATSFSDCSCTGGYGAPASGTLSEINPW